MKDEVPANHIFPADGAQAQEQQESKWKNGIIGQGEIEKNRMSALRYRIAVNAPGNRAGAGESDVGIIFIMNVGEINRAEQSDKAKK